MSGLLHIKRFRQNMLKLFAIYLVVILSTTSVITYSRYITSMESTSYARPARFNVTIDKGDICVAGTTTCNLAKYKHYDSLDYYFSVDTSQLEVTTTIAISVIVDDHYTFSRIYEIEDEQETLINIDSNDDYSISTLASEYRIDILRDIEAGLGDVKTYKVRLSYDGSSDVDPTYDAITVEFSAKQKD